MTIFNDSTGRVPVEAVNGLQGNVFLETDDIGEGVTNLYYTEARVSANSTVTLNTAKVSADGSVTTHSDISDAGSGNIITTGERNTLGTAIQPGDNVSELVNDAGYITSVGSITTDDVTEATNLYYTEARVSANVSVVANTAKVSADGSVTTHSDVTDAGSGQIITTGERNTLGTAIQPGDNVSELVNDAGYITSVGISDTDDLPEGSTNLYYTEARVNANPNVVANTAKISADGSVTTHSDVTNAGSGIIITGAERTLVNNSLQPGDNVSDLVNDAGYLTTTGITNSDDVPEGIVNLYYTDVRVSANPDVVDNIAKVSADGSVTTHSDITDAGSGAIITGVERSSIASAIQPGDNVSDLVNDAGYLTTTGLTTTDDLPEGLTNLYYTEARVTANTTVVSNTAKISADGPVTTHSDVTSAGSGQIITTPERISLTTAIQPGDNISLLTNDSGYLTSTGISDTDDVAEGIVNLYYTDARVSSNFTVSANTAKISADGSVTTHSDVTDAGSGEIITVGERTLVNNSLQPGDNVSELVNDAGYITSVGSITTDDVTEATNLYYTEARVTANTTVVANTAKISADGSVTTHSDVTDAGSGSIITTGERSLLNSALQNGDNVSELVNDAGYLTTTGITDSDDVPEGSTNLYYTETRVNANPNVVANTAKVSADGSVTTHSDVTDSGSGAIITVAERNLVTSALQNGDNVSELVNDAGYITSTGITDTDDVAEGVTNLYYTEARVSANSSVVANTAKISANGSVTTHSDVTDAGSGQIITVAERGLIASALQNGDNVSELVNDAGYLTSTGITDTDDVAEGTVNLYYTEARVTANSSVTANTAKVSADGSVTTHSDVTDSGSGQIITSGERTQINTNQTNITNLVQTRGYVETDGVGDNTVNYNNITETKIQFNGPNDVTGTGIIWNAANESFDVSFTGRVKIQYSVPTFSSGGRNSIEGNVVRDRSSTLTRRGTDFTYIRINGDHFNDTLNSYAEFDCQSGDQFYLDTIRSGSNTAATNITRIASFSIERIS